MLNCYGLFLLLKKNYSKLLHIAKNIFEKIRYLGIIGSVRLIRDFVLTSIFVKFGALVRHPFYIRSLGRLSIQSDFRCGPGLVLDIICTEAQVKVGKNFKASSRLHIGCADFIDIGDNVLVGTDVYISDHAHGQYKALNQSMASEIVNDRILVKSSIYIGNNVWIGDKVCILPGVKIGDNSIVGALSVVNKDVDPNSIYVGSPAKKIKYFDFELNRWVRESK